MLLTPDGLQLLRQIDVFVNEADLPQLKEAHDRALRLSGRDAHLVKADGTVAKLRVDPARAGAKLLAEERAGLFVEMGEAWLDDLRWVLDLPLDRSRMHVMTFLDTSDADVARLFDDAAGALHVNAPLTSAEEVIAVLKTFERETVFVVGHVEDGSLVIRNPAGEIVVAVRIDELERSCASGRHLVDCARMRDCGCDIRGFPERRRSNPGREGAGCCHCSAFHGPRLVHALAHQRRPDAATPVRRCTEGGLRCA